jgi:hypothetical protein
LVAHALATDHRGQPELLLGRWRDMTTILYTVEAADLHAHLFRVTLTIPEPAAAQTVSLPVWIPGSYLVREFSKNLQNLTGKQGRRSVARPGAGAELRGLRV